MIKIMKRNSRSLVFLLLIAVAAIGLSGALSFAAPTAGQANNNKARTRTKAPYHSPGECKIQCYADYKTCLSHRDGESCHLERAKCLETCDGGPEKPPTRIKARPRTPRQPTP